MHKEPWCTGQVMSLHPCHRGRKGVSREVDRQEPGRGERTPGLGFLRKGTHLSLANHRAIKNSLTQGLLFSQFLQKDLGEDKAT